MSVEGELETRLCSYFDNIANEVPFQFYISSDRGGLGADGVVDNYWVDQLSNREKRGTEKRKRKLQRSRYDPSNWRSTSDMLHQTATSSFKQQKPAVKNLKQSRNKKTGKSETVSDGGASREDLRKRLHEKIKALQQQQQQPKEKKFTKDEIKAFRQLKRSQKNGTRSSGETACSNIQSGIPNNEKIKSTNNEKIKSPNNEKIKSPNNEKIKSPNNEKIKSPNNEKIKSPNNEKIKSPNNEKIKSPNNEKIKKKNATKNDSETDFMFNTLVAKGTPSQEKRKQDELIETGVHVVKRRRMQEALKEMEKKQNQRANWSAEKREEVELKEALDKAVVKASGDKVFDNPTKLKKAFKAREKKHAKSVRAYHEKKNAVEEKQHEAARKRLNNVKKRIDKTKRRPG